MSRLNSTATYQKKILVFEYITGGGLAQETLTDSLAREGWLMLNTLLKGLCLIPDIQLTVLLDWRYCHLVIEKEIEIITIDKDQDVFDLLPYLIEQSDYVWPIAPEMQGDLYHLSVMIENKQKILLNSNSDTIALCSDKLRTYEILKQHNITTVETHQLDVFLQDKDKEWVIKPKDGAGCINSFLVINSMQFNRVVNGLEQKKDYIIQPYIKGDNLSLSCLFKHGKAWLICCNRQYITSDHGQFELTECMVNIEMEHRLKYQTLIDRLAFVFTGLWGYVGIDIIETGDLEIIVLEINPRLTTSYAGIYAALGVNLAETIFNMHNNDPIMIPLYNLQYKISL